MTPGLHVRELNKRYGSIAALTDVSLSVRDGEVLGLIGPNGAGKTTLFECIAGVLPADSGTVMVKDRPVSGSDRGSHLFFMPGGISITVKFKTIAGDADRASGSNVDPPRMFQLQLRYQF